MDAFVLMAEDRRELANLFVEVLRMKGIENEVVIARDGVEALEYLFGEGEHSGRDASALPALVMMDMNMPRMGGLEALQRIRADVRTELVPVVIFSSTRFPDDVAEAYRLGANGFVDKAALDGPPYPELVSLMVRYWLSVNERPYR